MMRNHGDLIAFETIAGVNARSPFIRTSIKELGTSAQAARNMTYRRDMSHVSVMLQTTSTTLCEALAKIWADKVEASEHWRTLCSSLLEHRR